MKEIPRSYVGGVVAMVCLAIGLVLGARVIGTQGSSDSASPSTDRTGDTADLSADLPGVAGEVAPIDPADSDLLYTKGEFDLPDGKQGEIAIIASLPSDRSGSVPLIVRNNTPDTLVRIGVQGVVRGPNGDLLASGSDHGLHPVVVEPGEIAIGFVYFDGVFDPFPKGTEYSFTTDGYLESEADFNIRDMSILEASFSGGDIERIVGFAENPYDYELTDTYSVGAACFSSSGKFIGHFSSFADKNGAASPGERLSFTIPTLTKCPAFIVGGSGYKPF